MNVLVIWAYSFCRSTLAFYRGLSVAFNVPLKLCIWQPIPEIRKKTGFSENEFNDMNITYIGDDLELAISILSKYKDAHHIFGGYQSVKIYQELILKAKSIGCHIGIASEAPCNMSPGYKHFLKECYIKFILPIKVRKQISASDFIINFSGNATKALNHIGWPTEKVIPCGYYSPKLEKAKLVKRTEDSWKNFSILLTGIHEWHRSPMLLLEAMAILKSRGITPECNITQEGPLLQRMKEFADKNGLDNVHFLGFVSMEKLIKLYETCSVYIGSGNYEPWGMRLNDALQCGAPLIVNKGMGGYMMVEDYGCGLTFEKKEAKGLAEAIETLLSNKTLYLSVAEKAYNTANLITPEIKSAIITNEIKRKIYGW